MSSISENRSTLKEFLASVATIKGDLSNITAPPFVLANNSTTELPQYWCEYPSILTAPASEPDPERRALLVLKWFLSSLKNQQYAGRDESEGVKKPLNAFLGEVFLAKWKDDAGETRLISEQVSHHPPVTACYLWNDDQGVRAEGYTCQEITFNGNVNIKQIGHAILSIDAFDEKHLIPLPSVKVSGILSGSLYPELTGTYHLASSSGFVSELSFSGKKLLGLGGGSKNHFEAKLYRERDPSNVLYTVTGEWNGTFTIHDVQNGRDIETYDTRTAKGTPIHVEDVSKQDDWESRKAWHGVIEGLNQGNMQATSDAKSVLEEAQRAMRKEEEARGETWQPIFFRSERSDPTFEKLANMCGMSYDANRTVGIWKLNADAVEHAKKPYHGDLTPTGRVDGRGAAAAQASKEEQRQ
ncbi:hypothetical protein LTS18_007730, partial [Coniosporium uncinatum]